MKFLPSLLSFFSLLGLCTSASAHYLWVRVEGNADGNTTANVYFEELPYPGDGHYLAPFVKRGKTWVRTAKEDRKELPIKEINLEKKKQRWLQSELKNSQPGSIESYGKWGVYQYGKTYVLLHYYARTLTGTSTEEINKLAKAPQMKADLVPHLSGQSVTLTLLWDGKPVPNRTVYIRGPKRFRQNVKTDKEGQVTFKAEGEGIYALRSSVEFKESGTFEEKAYTVIRHNTSLVLSLPLKKSR